MVKNFIKLFIISSFLLFVTGCAKYNADMEIKKDKSMLFTITGAIDKSQINDNSIKTTLNINDRRKYESKGYYIEDYIENNYEGYKLTLDVGNIDDLSAEEDIQVNLSDISNDTKLFKIKKGIFYNKYIANIKFDIDEINNYNMENNYDSLDISFSVKLPYKPISHNAIMTDGNKLIWKNQNNSIPKNIQFEFYIFNFNPIIIIGAGILLIIIIMIFLIKTLTKGIVNNDNNNDQKQIRPQPNQINTSQEEEVKSGFIPFTDNVNDNNIDINKQENIAMENTTNEFNNIVDENIQTNVDMVSNNDMPLEFEIPDPISTNIQNNEVQIEQEFDEINVNNEEIALPIDEDKIIIEEPLEKIIITEPIPKQNEVL